MPPPIVRGPASLEHDQERLLDEASAVVKEQAIYMKKAIENDSLRDALKHASNMICELRTSLLSPKNYYELYMQVFHELQHLSSFFADRRRHGRKMSEMYESVQHAGNILPRLYLLVTVGACYIRSKEAPSAVKDILTDMTELCKGVQHPMRGLFLRYYLTQMCKDKLPDAGSEYESDGGGSTTDAFEFLFQNFVEAARLWVRLQNQGAARDRQKREKERHDLRVLVGANLVRMAQLEGMTIEFYEEVAFPRIIEQLVTFKDVLAQQYLLDCVIQVFSDECHLRTLKQFLDACFRTQSNVDLKPILLNLMNRLTEFARMNPDGIPESVDVFGLFHSHVLQLFQRFIDKTLNQMQSQLTSSSVPPKHTIRADPTESLSKDNSMSTENSPATTSGLSLSNLLEVQVVFLNFTLNLYPDRLDYVDRILAATTNLLASVFPDASQSAAVPSTASRFLEGPPAAVASVMELLSAPLRTFSLTILQMDHFPNLMRYLAYPTRKEVASAMVTAVLDSGVPLQDPEAVTRFFTFVSPLIKDEEGGKSQQSQSSESFKAEQQQICRLLHLIHHVDTDQEFAMLNTARSCINLGGSRRFVHTYPGLVYSALRLIPRILSRELNAVKGNGLISSDWTDKTAAADLNRLSLEDSSRGGLFDEDEEEDRERMNQKVLTSPPGIAAQRVFHFVHKISSELVALAPEVAMHLFLDAAIVADDAEQQIPGPYEPICYEFLTQALVCFEEEFSESKTQFRGISLLVGTLCSHVTCLESDNYENLAMKVTQHSARLLRKADSCRAVLLCSNLFWTQRERRDERRVLECLQKCLKIADVAVQSSSTHVVLFVEILEKYLFYYEQNNSEIPMQSLENLLALCSEHLVYSEGTENCDDARRHFQNLIAYIRHKSSVEKDPKFADMRLESDGAKE